MKPGPSSKKRRRPSAQKRSTEVVKSEYHEEDEIDLSHLGSDPVSEGFEGMAGHFIEDSEERPLKPPCPVAPKSKSGEVRGLNLIER